MPAEVVAALAIAALIVALLALVLVLLFGWRSARQRRRAASGTDPRADLGPAVERALSQLDELTRRADAVNGRLQIVEDQGRRAVQRVGVVRFNPFEDTGGNQSFSLVMLDSKLDGVVISSLHSRQATRVYLKSIAAGKSETALSDEESEALRKAGVTTA